jgi:hypothetical protein
MCEFVFDASNGLKHSLEVNNQEQMPGLKYSSQQNPHNLQPLIHAGVCLCLMYSDSQGSKSAGSGGTVGGVTVSW